MPNEQVVAMYIMVS